MMMQQVENEQLYQQIKAHLQINTLRLTEELTELPNLQQDASEAAAVAQHMRDDAKDALDHVRAEAAAGIRLLDVDAKKPRSETQISSEILLDENVRAAATRLRWCEYSLSMWKSLADGIRTKSRSIQIISDLIQAGYTSPQTIYSERRTKPREVR